MSDKSTPWRIERNHKMQFCVARMDEDGEREVVRSASGRESCFKTWRGALYALNKARREDLARADRRIDGYNPEFLGAKPARAGQDY